tara:strand:+ start:2833 stop:3144 length:312 start_codon:yes stop_codon:yes gene_type:complete
MEAARRRPPTPIAVPQAAEAPLADELSTATGRWTAGFGATSPTGVYDFNDPPTSFADYFVWWYVWPVTFFYLMPWTLALVLSLVGIQVMLIRPRRLWRALRAA